MDKVIILVALFVTAFAFGMVIDGATALVLHAGLISIVWGLVKILMAIPAAAGIMVITAIYLTNPSKKSAFFYNRLKNRQPK